MIRVSLGRLHQSNGLTVRGWEDGVQGLHPSLYNIQDVVTLREEGLPKRIKVSLVKRDGESKKTV